jgi:acetyl-CoA C-acetyltransferase
MGQVEFKDFLWEAFTDPARAWAWATRPRTWHASTASRATMWTVRGAAASPRVAAWDSGYFADEVAAVGNAEFALPGYQSRALRLADRKDGFARDEHVKPTPLETLPSSSRPSRACRPAATARPSSMARRPCWWPRAPMFARTASSRWRASWPAAPAGVPPEDHGHRPGAGHPCRAGRLAHAAGSEIGRVEINEAFGAQYLACERELGLDRSRTNTRGGAIAIGHPLVHRACA